MKAAPATTAVQSAPKSAPHGSGMKVIARGKPPAPASM